jgi:hypothetical protein
MWEAPTDKELEEEEYEAYIKENNWNASGRSAICGY